MPKKLVEIARSFSYKLNTGNYESRDFFCSQKIEVPENQAIEASEKLFEFCKDEVMKSVYNYKLENMPISVEPAFKKSAQGLVAKSDVEDVIGEEKKFKEEEAEKANELLNEETI